MKSGTSSGIAVFFAAFSSPVFSVAQGQDEALNVRISAPEEARTLVGDPTAEVLIDLEWLKGQIADPEQAVEYLRQEMEAADKESEKDIRARTIARLVVVNRPRKVRLSVEDALHRALQHNYSIEVESYNPAIRQSAITEAEAAFDAALFSSLTKQIQDRPTGSQLQASNVDLFNWQTGVRKLLPSGMLVESAYTVRRTSTNLQFQFLNPSWNSTMTFSFRQPLLRGFGLDYNRSAIRVNKNNKAISDLAFHVQVRETLRGVESAYWQLVQARRDVVITARLLEEFVSLYEILRKRIILDALPVQVQASQAQLASTRADFIRVVENVHIAEYRLIQLLNDPELNLADDIEIVPEGLPMIAPVVVDRIGEIQTAIERRPEIKEAELALANSRIAVGQAKNQALPRLDVSFSYDVNGLGTTWDNSFDQLSRHDYVDYTIGVELEVPIGNRSARARQKQANLTELQARVRLKDAIENVILQVNVTVRELATNYALVNPRYESVQAGVAQINSIKQRAERNDFAQTNAELNAHNNLASSRRALLAAMVNYHIGIVNLEAAKGTLLRYYNVALPSDEDSTPRP